MRSNAIHSTGPNPALLKQVRDDLGQRVFSLADAGRAIRAIAEKLDGGAKFYLKYGTGANLSRVIDRDLKTEIERVEISASEALALVEMAALVCLNNEGWGAGVNVLLAELKTLDREISGSTGRLDKFTALLKDLVLFKSLNETLRQRKDVTVHFDGVPLFSVAGNKAETMLALREKDPIDIVVGAIDVWMEGEIRVPAKHWVVQLDDIVKIARADGWLENSETEEAEG
jgi:hypothetical protein